MIGRTHDSGLEAQFHKDFEGSGLHLAAWGRADMVARIPGLRPGWDRAVWEANTADVDVAALHQAYLRAAGRAGVELTLRQHVSRIQRDSQGIWMITAPGGTWRAARVINASGAWASDVGRMAGALPIPIQPLRRTMVQLRLGCDIPLDLPLTIDLAGRFYFKPEGPRRLWLSPHDETPTPACDAAPEEVDVARAIAELQDVVEWPIAAVERRWAGLRSFAPDRAPVFGADAEMPGFYWCAGQGGFGIQTAPAIAALLAAEILGMAPAAPYDELDPLPYRPARFS
jgi:D-arginine dehydrogenase